MKKYINILIIYFIKLLKNNDNKINYKKVKADYPQYYRNALLYLSSINIDDLSNEEKVERAYELALSALLGEGLYNFGELVSKLILINKNFIFANKRIYI